MTKQVYPCDSGDHCPYGDSASGYHCYNHCGLGADESEDIESMESDVGENKRTYWTIDAESESINVTLDEDTFTVHPWEPAGDSYPADTYFWSAILTLLEEVIEENAKLIAERSNNNEYR